MMVIETQVKKTIKSTFFSNYYSIMQYECVHLFKFDVKIGFRTQAPVRFEITDVKHGVKHLYMPYFNIYKI